MDRLLLITGAVAAWFTVTAFYKLLQLCCMGILYVIRVLAGLNARQYILILLVILLYAFVGYLEG